MSEPRPGAPPHGEPLFHIALCEPEIPNNTGNIGRTCVATRCALHLIHPLGFDVSEKACRRAGLDYWPRLDVREHASLDAYLAVGPSPRPLPEGGAGVGSPPPPPRLWVFSTRATRPVWEADLKRGDHLLFGKETRGLPPAVLERFHNRLLLLPMVEGERSLNLATAVCAVIYEGVRQLVSAGAAGIDNGRLRIPD